MNIDVILHGNVCGIVEKDTLVATIMRVIFVLCVIKILIGLSMALSSTELSYSGTDSITWAVESKLAYQGYDRMVPYELQLSFSNESSRIGIGDGVNILVYMPFAVYSANDTGNMLSIWDLNKGGRVTMCKNSRLSISSITSSGCGTRGLYTQASCDRQCYFRGFVNDVPSTIELTFEEAVHKAPLVYKGCSELIISTVSGTLVVLNCETLAFDDISTIQLSVSKYKGSLEFDESTRTIGMYWQTSNLGVIEMMTVSFAVAITIVRVNVMFSGIPKNLHVVTVSASVIRNVCSGITYSDLIVMSTVLSTTIYGVFYAAYSGGNTLQHSNINEELFKSVLWMHMGVQMLGWLVCQNVILWMGALLYVTRQPVWMQSYITKWSSNTLIGALMRTSTSTEVSVMFVLFVNVYEYLLLSGFYFYLFTHVDNELRRLIGVGISVRFIYALGRDAYALVYGMGIIGPIYILSVCVHFSLFVLYVNLESFYTYPEVTHVWVCSSFACFIFAVGFFYVYIIKY